MLVVIGSHNSDVAFFGMVIGSHNSDIAFFGICLIMQLKFAMGSIGSEGVSDRVISSLGRHYEETFLPFTLP